MLQISLQQWKVLYISLLIVTEHLMKHGNNNYRYTFHTSIGIFWEVFYIYIASFRTVFSGKWSSTAILLSLLTTWPYYAIKQQQFLETYKSSAKEKKMEIPLLYFIAIDRKCVTSVGGATEMRLLFARIFKILSTSSQQLGEIHRASVFMFTHARSCEQKKLFF